MPNQKISELTTIITVDNAVDLFPIVDTSANTTKKITPTALKTALALDNVNNTSDANKPVSTAQQDALNAKVTANAAITAGTAPKVTFDAKGLVTAGNILDAADMPTGINAANIGTGVVSSTEFGYLDGVTSAIQTQINAKQATLVSGTNIKTINGATVLGAGDITIAGNPPSGVSGAIQFSNGSAFASDASNLFWDDTNNRLGIGTNAPTARAHIKGVGATSSSTSFLVQNSLGHNNLKITDDGAVKIENDFANNKFVIGWPDGSESLIFDYTTIRTGGGNPLNISGLQTNIGSYAGTRLTTSNTGTTIYGSGSTSATTSLLVQNSAGTTALNVRDDLTTLFFGALNLGNGNTIISQQSGNLRFEAVNSITSDIRINPFRQVNINNGNTYTAQASAILQVDSTTKGFLPPVMTTTQKNAIATPAAGLVVYDTTTNKLCCYNGSTWNDLF